MKQFEVDWRFCPECQCIQLRAADGGWQECRHDYRPNSPKGVLENQAKELDQIHSGDLRELFREVRTYQSPYEIDSMIAIARWYCNNPINIVEVGSFHGGTANLMRFFFPINKLICVDRCFDYWMAWELSDLTKIKGDSCAPETVESFRMALGDDKVDLLFIDGDHSYAGEMADYKMYSPFVRDGGMIAFHDTHAIPDVGRIFQEVPGKAKFDLFSYQGIGLVIK